jgi:hypothetical protein
MNLEWRSNEEWDEKCIQSFGRKIKRKRPLGRPSRRWDDNITIDLREIRRKALD